MMDVGIHVTLKADWLGVMGKVSPHRLSVMQVCRLNAEISRSWVGGGERGV